MPCAAGELCPWQDSTPKEPGDHTCRGGCGDRLHSNCGDVDQEVEKNVSDDEKEEGEDYSGGRAVPPPYAELSSDVRTLESVAEKCGMKEAAHHLQKVKMAMVHVHASRPARQTDIRAFAAVTERGDGERSGSGSVS